MSELIDAHIAHLRRANNRAATIRDRRQVLRRLNRYFDGRPELAEVELADLERWQDWQRRTVSASSLHTYTAHVRAFYAWAYDTDRLPTNPARHLVRVKIPRGVPRPIPVADLKIALRTARGDTLPMLIIGGYLGLRAGEIAAIRGEDLITEGGRTFLIVRGKGGKERAVPVADPVLAMLAPWLRTRGPMFRTVTGQAINVRHVIVAVSGHFRSLGMPYVSHQLRHRAATRLLQLTQNPRLVQEILGHADLRQTAGYTAISSEENVRAMERLARDLGPDCGEAA